MQRTVITAFVIILLTSTMFAESIYTKRKNNYVREGPGSFYELVLVVPENTGLTVLERAGNWIKVQLPTQRSGWIAVNCITSKRNEAVPATSLENVWSSPKASKAGIAAAVKGFGGKHSKTNPGNVDLVLKHSVKTFQPWELQSFYQEVQRQPSSNKGRVDLDDIDVVKAEYDAGLDEQKIGVGIAARILGRGITVDPQLIKYVNLICATLVLNASAYDWDFTVFILDDSTINGFAVPGGYIFITLGALRLCVDESEIAAIIGHEVAHVVQRHGMQEMTKRSVNIQAEEALSELEEATEKNTEEEKVLEDMMEGMFEKVIARRTLSYELEADKISSVLCANAGYDPFGIVRVSEKVAKLPSERPDIFDTNFMSPNDAVARFRENESFSERRFKASNAGARMISRFVENMRTVR